MKNASMSRLISSKIRILQDHIWGVETCVTAVKFERMRGKCQRYWVIWIPGCPAEVLCNIQYGRTITNNGRYCDVSN